MSNKKIAILGASGHGKVVAEIAELNGFAIEFYDDAFPVKSEIEHWLIKGDTSALLENLQSYTGVAVGIGNNSIRESKIQLLLNRDIDLPVLVHPSAQISGYSTLGKGTVVMAGAIINPFVKVGLGAIINTGAVLEHDCQLDDFVHISPNATLAGECRVGARAWFGIGSCIKQQLEVGADSIVGAGSVVVTNISAGRIAYGNPAKEKKDN